MATPTSRFGFTLLELSIVLVIIGLLAGSVIVGRNLIRSAELQSVVSDAQEYEQATKIFQEKYLSLPGDMPNATEFWGEVNSDPYACHANDTDSGQLTCNGNGDGQVLIYSPTSDLLNEPNFFWQHLSNAGLTQRRYLGVVMGSAGVRIEDVLPKAKLADTYFSVTYAPLIGSEQTKHIFFVGRYPSEDQFSYGASIYAADAYTIDSKLDDGLPASGKVQSVTFFDASNCTAGSPAKYKESDASAKCALFIYNDF